MPLKNVRLLVIEAAVADVLKSNHPGPILGVVAGLQIRAKRTVRECARFVGRESLYRDPCPAGGQPARPFATEASPLLGFCPTHAANASFTSRSTLFRSSPNTICAF